MPRLRGALGQRAELAHTMGRVQSSEQLYQQGIEVRAAIQKGLAAAPPISLVHGGLGSEEHGARGGGGWREQLYMRGCSFADSRVGDDLSGLVFNWYGSGRTHRS